MTIHVVVRTRREYGDEETTLIAAYADSLAADAHAERLQTLADERGRASELWRRGQAAEEYDVEEVEYDSAVSVAIAEVLRRAEQEACR